MSPQFIAHYRVTGKLGEGGMGEVWRATDTKLNREIALKILPQAFARDAVRVARFTREAQVLAALNHPNIAAIYGVEDGTLVMELVEGPTLAGRIKTGPLPLDEALGIARQIAEGLEAAHEKGIIHRDLKPANIKIGLDGRVKVLDFGLATAVQDPERESLNPANSPTLTMGATDIGMILGTAAYMSPEQASGRRVDKRADVWSFGVVLWEMLTGKLLFDAGETVSHTLADVLRAPLDFTALPSGTPAPVRELLKRCLDRDVKSRLRDIGEARIAIERYLANPADAADLTTAAGGPLNRLPWAVAAVLTLALAILGYLQFRPAPAARTLRYTIDGPENGRVHSLAVSPDGRYLAIATRIKGKQMLWLRSLDALEAHAIPFTEEALYPFWSPDSRYVAFFARNKLKKIAVSGGPAQELCDVKGGTPRGGSWSRRNVIVFFSGVGGRTVIQRIPSSGGTSADTTRTDGAYRYPFFLPDGDHMLFLVEQGSPEKNGIYFGSPDGKEDRRILTDLSGAAFAAGHLLFIRNGTLMAQPFDPVEGSSGSDGFPIAEGVILSELRYAPVTASDSGLLLYQRGRRHAYSGRGQLVWNDRAGKPLGPFSGEAESGGMPVISPDEKRVALVHSATDVYSGGSDLWIWNLARGTSTRFTSRPISNQSPVWSPDGSRIVFAHFDQTQSYELMQKAANQTGQEEVLLRIASTGGVNQWSRDGRFVVYTMQNSKSKLEVWILPMSGRDPKPIPFRQSEFHELQGQLSPDSRWMAYVSDESGAFEVYVRPFPSGAGLYRISAAGGYQPRWRGDGKELYYLAEDGKMIAVSVNAGAGPNATFEPGTPVALFDSHIEIRVLTNINAPGPVYDYDVSDDGKRFLLATAGEAASAPPLTVVTNWVAASKK